ncbi:MAG: SGNH hydrolase domain-containing protein, partial [Acidimicrobiales bacterium]
EGEIVGLGDLTLSAATRGGCPWQRDVFVTPVVMNGEASQDTCDAFRDDLYDRVIPALEPDVVVLINNAYDTLDQYILYLGPDREVLPINSPELTGWVEQATDDAVAELRADGRSLVLIEPIPYDPTLDPLACLSEAAVVEECRRAMNAGASFLERAYRRLDRADDALWALDLDELVCPFLPICDPIVGGEVVWADANHLTRVFAASLAPAVADYLVANRIIEP